MAFPSVASADSKNGVQSSNSTSWTLTYPTNLANGDLILAFMAMDGNSSAVTFPAGWVTGGSGTTSVVGIVAKKKSNGTETGNFSVTTPSEQGCWRVIRIPAGQWEGTLGTTFANSNANDGAVTVVSTTSAGAANTAPNPGANNPFNWAAEDTLWIAASSNDSTPTVTGFPTNYTQQDHSTAGGHAQSSGGSNGAGQGIAFRQLNTASEDPAAFTLSGSEEWCCNLVAVRPAAFTDPVQNDTATASDTRAAEGSTSFADTATATETNSGATSISVNDTATASDNNSAEPFISVADTATASDTRSTDGTVNQADTATAGETKTAEGSASFADTATANDGNSVENFVAVSDTATANDANSATGASTQADTASASDARATEGAVSTTDAGTAGDGNTTTAGAVFADAAIASDARSSDGAFSLADTATAADGNSYEEIGGGPPTEVTINDTASASDSVSASAQASQSDSATAADARTLESNISHADAAEAVDAHSFSVSVVVVDSAFSDDGTARDAFIIQNDVAVASDSNSYAETSPPIILVAPHFINLLSGESHIILSSGVTRINLEAGESFIQLDGN